MSNPLKSVTKRFDIKEPSNPYLKSIEYYTFESIGTKLFDNKELAQALINNTLENGVSSIEFVPENSFDSYNCRINKSLLLPERIYCGDLPTLDEVIRKIEEYDDLSCILASIGTRLICEKDYDSPNSQNFKIILSHYFCSDFGSREYFKYAGKTFIKSTTINPLQNIILRELEMIFGESVMVMALKYGKDCFRSDINFAIKDTYGEEIVKMLLDLDSLCRKYDLDLTDSKLSKEDKKRLEAEIIKQYRRLQCTIIYVLAPPEKRRPLAEVGAYLNENGSHRIIDRSGDPEKKLSFMISEKLF